MAVWTYHQVRELDHRQRVKAVARYRREIRTIQVAMNIAPKNGQGSEVDLESGISSQPHSIATDQVPPYESIANTAKYI